MNDEDARTVLRDAFEHCAQVADERYATLVPAVRSRLHRHRRTVRLRVAAGAALAGAGATAAVATGLPLPRPSHDVTLGASGGSSPLGGQVHTNRLDCRHLPGTTAYRTAAAPDAEELVVCHNRDGRVEGTILFGYSARDLGNAVNATGAPVDGVLRCPESRPAGQPRVPSYSVTLISRDIRGGTAVSRSGSLECDPRTLVFGGDGSDARRTGGADGDTGVTSEYALGEFRRFLAPPPR